VLGDSRTSILINKISIYNSDLSIIIDTMARKPFADREVQRELCAQLRAYLDKPPRQNKTALAKQLGISRAALYQYRKGETTPSTEILIKLLSLPGIKITLAGRTFAPSDFRPVEERPKVEPLQFDLPFDMPVYIDAEAQDLTIGIIRRGPRRAGSLEFTVEIKFPKAV